jgi:hypothetical protein
LSVKNLNEVSALLCSLGGSRISPVKPVNAACGIDQLLFAGEKRVTRRTYFNMKVLAHC